MDFFQKLQFQSEKNASLLCIGLDSDIEKLPLFLKDTKNSQFSFNTSIIDATHDLVCAYKPNIAFYEACGAQGIEELKTTISYIKTTYPEIPVILDAKRADIGNTNERSASFAFDYLQADAITVHPYLGKTALEPFFSRTDKGIFVLCRTSNPGAAEFQDLPVVLRSTDHPNGSGGADGGSVRLYQVVAQHVVSEWNTHGNCGLVVGATSPDELVIVRRLVGNLPILIPGIGSQGGELEKTVRGGVDADGEHAIITVSRSVIFASSETDFTRRAREEAKILRSAINRARGRMTD